LGGSPDRNSFKELAKMDEELKLKLQRDREELLRQMEAAVGCVI
jgi:hypothetical protein